MSPTDRLRSLTTPDSSRWKPMLMSLGLSAASAGAAVHFQASDLVAMVMTVLAFIAWCVGTYAMVGYVRWFFASELQQARRNGADRSEGGNK
jgi:hypothetical protein